MWNFKLEAWGWLQPSWIFLCPLKYKINLFKWDKTNAIQIYVFHCVINGTYFFADWHKFCLKFPGNTSVNNTKIEVSTGNITKLNFYCLSKNSFDNMHYIMILKSSYKIELHSNMFWWWPPQYSRKSSLYWLKHCIMQSWLSYFAHAVQPCHIIYLHRNSTTVIVEFLGYSATVYLCLPCSTLVNKARWL